MSKSKLISANNITKNTSKYTVQEHLYSQKSETWQLFTLC